jgi:protein TonB
MAAAAIHGAMLYAVRLDLPRLGRAPERASVEFALEFESSPLQPLPATDIAPGLDARESDSSSSSARLEQESKPSALPNKNARSASGPDAVQSPGADTVEPPAATRVPPRKRASSNGDAAALRERSVSQSSDKGTREIGSDVSESAAQSEPEGFAPIERKRLTAAALDQQISELTSVYAQPRSADTAMPPRTAYVEDVRTDRYAADSYERAWQDKIERVGNMNYPEEARRKQLTGALMLTVAVNADGSIQQINVHRSSGHAELDDAAERIVRLASPFAPFPSQLKKDYDVLVITRTWRFFTDNRFATTP